MYPYNLRPFPECGDRQAPHHHRKLSLSGSGTKYSLRQPLWTCVWGPQRRMHRTQVPVQPRTVGTVRLHLGGLWHPVNKQCWGDRLLGAGTGQRLTGWGVISALRTEVQRVRGCLLSRPTEMLLSEKQQSLLNRTAFCSLQEIQLCSNFMGPPTYTWSTTRIKTLRLNICCAGPVVQLVIMSSQYTKAAGSIPSQGTYKNQPSDASLFPPSFLSNIKK